VIAKPVDACIPERSILANKRRFGSADEIAFNASKDHETALKVVEIKASLRDAVGMLLEASRQGRRVAYRAATGPPTWCNGLAD
jgi:hypothetical protein